MSIVKVSTTHALVVTRNSKQFKILKDTNLFILEKNPFKCAMCDNTFKIKWYLKTHSLNIHEQMEMLQCKHCQAIIKGKYSLWKSTIVQFVLKNSQERLS